LDPTEKILILFRFPERNQRTDFMD